MIVKDRKLCLVKGQGEETWALPGGFGEVGYSQRKYLKEIQEETGYVAVSIGCWQYLTPIATNCKAANM